MVKNHMVLLFTKIKMKQSKIFNLVLATISIIAFVCCFYSGHGEYALAVALLPTTALQRINLETEEAWTPTQRGIEQSMLQADSFQTFLARQVRLGRSFLQYITDPRKDYTDVRIKWIDFCGEAARDCTADNYCDGITGVEPGVDYKDYNITQCIVDDFSLNEQTFAGSSEDFQTHFREKQNQKIVNIVNRLNTKLLLFLNASHGFNRGGQFTINGTTGASEVPAAQFDDTRLVTRMMLDALKSKIINPYILDSGNLWITNTNVNFGAANPANAADVNRVRQFDVNYDILGFGNAGAAVTDSTFLITPYSSAFVNKNYYENAAPVYNPDVKMWQYSIPVPAFGITIDVLHQRTCLDLKKNRFAHTWRYTVHYDFLTNPYGCADANGKRVNGIIKYQKVA